MADVLFALTVDLGRAIHAMCSEVQARIEAAKDLPQTATRCSRLLDQIGRLGSAVHVFGHSHQNVDAVLDGVRYVQNALGHPDCDVPITVHPVVAFDATWVPQKTETVGMFTGAVTRCPKCGD